MITVHKPITVVATTTVITTTVILIHSTLSMHIYPTVHYTSKICLISEMGYTNDSPNTAGIISDVLGYVDIATILDLGMITEVAKAHQTATTVITLSTTTVIIYKSNKVVLSA